MRIDAALLGMGRTMLPLPGLIWKSAFRAAARTAAAGVSAMSSDHRRVHHFVVAQLPGAGAPMGPAAIESALALPHERVEKVLADLARRLTFIARNKRGEVSWAYPVTVEKTPHRAVLDTGEEAYSP